MLAPMTAVNVLDGAGSGGPGLGNVPDAARLVTSPSSLICGMVPAAPDTGMALGEALLEVLRDPQLRQRLADNGYRFVRQNHDRRVVAEQICSCYQRVLQAKNKLQEPRIKFQEGSYQ